MTLHGFTTATAGPGSNITINVPAGTTNGDLLLAFVAQASQDVNIDTPTGWTLEGTADPGTGQIRCFSRVASSEPANYTFSRGAGTNPDGWDAIMYRISGQISVSPITAGSDTNINEDGTSHVFAAGITPASANTFFFIGYLLNDGATASVTISSYAIATDNPTWTEDLDAGISGNGMMGAASATGRTQSTATGDVTVTLSGSPGAGSDHGVIIVSVRPEPNVTVSPAVIEATATINAPTVTGSAAISPAVIEATATINAPTVTTAAPTWNNPDKTAAPSWNNPDKT